MQEQIPNALDTLRLSRRQLQAVVQFLRRQQDNFHGAEVRAEPRLPFSAEGGVAIELRHPGGTVGRYLIRPHNLSSRGMGFLNGAFVYPGTACVVLLPKLAGHGARRIAGQAVRCRHVAGNVHEVGVRFEEPLDLSEFIADPAAAKASAAPAGDTGPRFQGAVLAVEDSVDGRELLNFLLGRLGIAATFIAKKREAIELIERRRFDIVFVNAELSATPGGELIHAMRRANYPGPIVALTIDDDEDAAGRLTSKGASHVLVKPVQLDKLTALAEMYLEPAGGGAAGEPPVDPLLSEHWDDVRMRPLIVNFLDRLDTRIPRLRDAMNAGDTDALRAACKELQGTATGYGYPTLSYAAAELHRCLGSRSTDDDPRAAFDDLLRLAKAACLARRTAKAKSA